MNRIRGCLLGGAIGDALGAPVEFMSTAEIRRRFGPDGIGDYLLRDLELRDAITAIADDLAAYPTSDLYGDDDERIWKRYPGW